MPKQNKEYQKHPQKLKQVRSKNLSKIIVSREQVEKASQEAHMNIFAVYVLADIQEYLIINAEQILNKVGNYKFDIKKDIETMKRITAGFRHHVNKHVSEESNELFGEICDNITEGIMKIITDNSLKL